MTKWHAHIIHMAKHINMVAGRLLGGPKSRTPSPLTTTAFNGRMYCFLLRCIRFDNRATKDKRIKENPFAAVSKIWEAFINNCKQRYWPGENITINEQLLQFRGRCGFRMYLWSKPAQYGLKIMMVCNSKSSCMLNAMP